MADLSPIRAGLSRLRFYDCGGPSMRFRRQVRWAMTGLIACAIGSMEPARGQSAAPSPAGALRSRPAARAAAPAPVPPETVSRTAEGAITIRAVRIPEGLRLDGRLD